ncbi:MAG: Rne/Rng family ribonuclease [Anaerohalosphaeraceae bacterium]|nr:Rne/Rng family ribonuclease [Anaerohalosphaeraceae bacterium]
MSIEMVVNYSEGQECRVAIVDSGSLEELYIERPSSSGHVGSIYKGKVVNVEPGIQAAFVDFGSGKNGFLHISDLHPKYFTRKGAKCTENIGKRKSLKDRPPIQQCLKKGQELIVQVTKEGINTKGPTMTTYLALPGKYIVMMPWMHKLGVSQKIEDEEERARLKDILESIDIPEKAGFILRTAASGCSKREIQRDISYISRLWKAISKRIDKVSTPAELYKESDLIIRVMRDIFSSNISKIVCDNESVAKKIRDFLGIVQPRMKKRVSFYESKVPLFHKYKVEGEISKIQMRQVKLKSGGSIVIEQTEALVAIDVNSGKYRKHSNAEQTALKINVEAANEIARQLKLRDLGGLIICDFIDMRDNKNRREVEKVFRAALKNDKARSRILKISSFGIIEMTRQRMRPSLQYSTFLRCPHCSGTGMIKSYESIAIEVLRAMNTASAVKEIKLIEVSVNPEVAEFLQNSRRAAIFKIEADEQKQIVIKSDGACTAEQSNIVCYDERQGVVKFTH